MEFKFNDGGREAAGYKGRTGDCAVRAIAIATGMPYQEVYDLVLQFGAKERTGKRKKSKSHPRTGVYSSTMKKIMDHLNWKWTPTMHIGSGCTVHMRAEELPTGTIILSVSRHYCAVIDGVVHDTFQEDRDGKRCVYGYWSAPS